MLVFLTGANMTQMFDYLAIKKNPNKIKSY